MAESALLYRVHERGWRSGMTNLLRKENGLWWNTRRWWVQSIVWYFILNGLVTLLLWIIPALDPGDSPAIDEIYGVFFQMWPITTIGVMVLMQSSVVSEKQSGTAAWIMSNPVSRISFILSKFIANTFAILIILVGLQGLIGYAQFSLKAKALMPMAPYLRAFGVLSLHLVFYIALALMLGAIFRGRGAVIGISLGLLVFQDLASQILVIKWPWFPSLLPSTLGFYIPLLAEGEALPSMNPIIVTSLLIPIFIVLAIWNFSKEEF